ncbi:unnamed protein product [Euphydryas editha]|uniref:TIL domain-containing protein n=1 Tax=Euphydryas editha TaxID=104508 RepID=A0AAU9U930_EUPED|nr:unnamed protein product [Euphydryas editha]
MKKGPKAARACVSLSRDRVSFNSVWDYLRLAGPTICAKLPAKLFTAYIYLIFLRNSILLAGQEECEEGTYSYTTGCGALTPEATCADPNPKPDTDGGSICDYSACYCNPPTVRHPESNKCVPLEECPK